MTEKTSEILKNGCLNHVVQYPPEYSMCTGCISCEMVCSVLHEGVVSPSLSRIKVKLGPTKTMLHTILSCTQCEDHPCYEKCPKKDKAMCIDPDTGIVYVNPDECIGCGLCAKNCRYEDSRIRMITVTGGKYKRRALKCDLCRGRAEGPACVQWCPARVLGLSEASNSNLTAPAVVSREVSK